MTLAQLSTATSIDQALLSKIEKGHRMSTEQQLYKLVDALDLHYIDLRKYFLREK